MFKSQQTGTYLSNLVTACSRAAFFSETIRLTDRYKNICLYRYLTKIVLIFTKKVSYLHQINQKIEMSIEFYFLPSEKENIRVFISCAYIILIKIIIICAKNNFLFQLILQVCYLENMSIIICEDLVSVC